MKYGQINGALKPLIACLEVTLQDISLKETIRWQNKYGDEGKLSFKHEFAHRFQRRVEHCAVVCQNPR